MIASAAAVLLSGCASGYAMTARDDVHRFLVAVRNDDQATFDAIVDQKAIAQSIATNRCLQTGARRDALFSCMSTTASQIGPIPLSAFRGVAASFGYERGRRPTGIVRVSARRDAYDQVCVSNKHFGPCVLWFIGQGDSWRLTSVIDPTQLEGL